MDWISLTLLTTRMSRPGSAWQVQRLRHQLREYFPAALEAFGQDLDAPDALELLGKAPARSGLAG